jgi:hypothetical protein
MLAGFLSTAFSSSGPEFQEQHLVGVLQFTQAIHKYVVLLAVNIMTAKCTAYIQLEKEIAKQEKISAIRCFNTGCFLTDCKYLHVLSSRKCGSIHPLPHTPPWRSA